MIIPEINISDKDLQQRNHPGIFLCKGAIKKGGWGITIQ